MTREDAKEFLIDHSSENELVCVDIKELSPVIPQPKIGYCKDCKWQKDSDGIFRRGINAESQCPINRREVFEGNGYCFLYEPKMQAESEGKNEDIYD